MNKSFVSALYVLNIVWQCILTLIIPPGLLAFTAWLIVFKLGAPSWVYVPFIIIGVLIGFVSMIRFAISASEGLERLEASRGKETREKEKKDISGDSK